MNAVILTIGDELLNGQTVDTNASWLGRQLNQIGVSISAKMSVGDDRERIIGGLDYAYNQSSMVIMTGGLGPTHDDITKHVLAEYFADTLVFHQETYDRMASYFKKTGRQPTEAHRLQSYMPTKATIITNGRGTAPGMWFTENGRSLISMPGVPSEMKGIMAKEGLPRIAALNPGQHIRHHLIQTAGAGETYVAEQIKDIIESFSDEINLAYLPGTASVKLRLTGVGPDQAKLETLIQEYGAKISDRLSSYVYAIGDTKIEEAVGSLAKKKNVTIGTAESCTGGSIARALTSISGSSAYFKGSVVAYANEVKQNVLNVPEETLTRHGAVSEETVIAMVEGLLHCLDIDVAVSISGIAGPSGGSPDKPVGTIWIAVGDKDRTVTKLLQLTKNRHLNIEYTVATALNQLRLFLKEL